MSNFKQQLQRICYDVVEVTSKEFLLSDRFTLENQYTLLLLEDDKLKLIPTINEEKQLDNATIFVDMNELLLFLEM